MKSQNWTSGLGHGGAKYIEREFSFQDTSSEKYLKNVHILATSSRVS